MLPESLQLATQLAFKSKFSQAFDMFLFILMLVGCDFSFYFIQCLLYSSSCLFLKAFIFSEFICPGIFWKLFKQLLCMFQKIILVQSFSNLFIMDQLAACHLMSGFLRVSFPQRHNPSARYISK